MIAKATGPGFKNPYHQPYAHEWLYPEEDRKKNPLVELQRAKMHYATCKQREVDEDNSQNKTT